MLEQYIKTPTNSDYVSDFLVLPEGLNEEVVIDIFVEYLAPMRLSRRDTYEHMAALLGECSFIEKYEFSDEGPKSFTVLRYEVEISI